MSYTDQPLATKEKFAYGLGDAAANFVFQTQITFLMYFYTDVFGLAARTAGTILLVSRVIDAFNDPIVGAIADRTNTRWGRYRPWLLWTALPMAIVLVLCYTTPPLGIAGKIIWATVTYNALMILYAANNVPYCALSGVMTSDSQERTSLASWRFVCAMGTALVVNMFTLKLVEYFGRGDTAFGFQMTMALWGAIAVLFFVTAFAFTNERIQPSSKQQSSIRQDLSDLLSNGPWLALFVLALLIYIQLAMRSGAMLYYFDYYSEVKSGIEWIDAFGIFNGVGLGSVIVGVLLSKPLSERFGKRNTFRVCLLLSAVLMAAFALVPPHSMRLLLGLQMLMQLVFGPTIPILWAMMADVADYSEWRTGRRSTALAFASIVFGLKLGSGIGGWLNGQLLDYFGYLDTAVQSQTTTRGIVLMVSVLPAGFLLLGLCVLFCYSLDDRLVQQIEQTLNARRNMLKASPEIMPEQTT